MTTEGLNSGSITRSDRTKYLYALGFRNAFDRKFRDNGDLLVSDNGPTGMDNLIIVEAGENYAWSLDSIINPILRI